MTFGEWIKDKAPGILEAIKNSSGMCLSNRLEDYFRDCWNTAQIKTVQSKEQKIDIYLKNGKTFKDKSAVDYPYTVLSENFVVFKHDNKLIIYSMSEVEHLETEV